MSDAAQPPPGSRHSRLARSAVGVGVAVLAAGSIYGLLAFFGGPAVTPTPPDADPNLPARSPYLNVAPGVQYVGDDVCARCHRSHTESFRRHPMGRSLAPVGDPADHPEHTRPAGSPFDALRVQFHVERRGNRIIHAEVAYDASRRPVAQTEEAVSYVVGSGTHAYSYLIRHDGVLTQSPITWFAQKRAWDLSPGFDAIPDHFERTIAPGCLFCHSN